jgi:pimeloyl-ACP methyl ester carboxylesterase
MTALPPALDAPTTMLDGPAGRVCLYRAGPPTEATARPLLLIHSVNAAASAAEVRPLFEHYRQRRPTYALDLPGFGLSERSARAYTPRLMTDAVHAAQAALSARHGGAAVDALALSLGTEFLTRAACERPGAYRTVALVSPTGFNRPELPQGAPDTVRGSFGVHGVLARPWLGPRLFRWLTRPGIVRYFLQRTWGAKQIDEDLWRYAVLTAQAPGAEHAPLTFLSALLFSADIGPLYRALTMPVWMVHGVRGDFTDYRGKAQLADRGNWRFSVLPTGAIPYFEVLPEFLAEYDAFLATA